MEHTMKAYKGSGGKNVFILESGITIWSYVVSFTLRPTLLHKARTWWGGPNLSLRASLAALLNYVDQNYAHCCQYHHKLFFQNSFILIQKIKSRGPCLKPLHLTIPVSSLLLYCYQKGEQEKPGNLLTNSNFLPFTGKWVSCFCHDFFLHLVFCYAFCLSYSLQNNDFVGGPGPSAITVKIDMCLFIGRMAEGFIWTQWRRRKSCGFRKTILHHLDCSQTL
jgi:hypothetical protein